MLEMKQANDGTFQQASIGRRLITRVGARHPPYCWYLRRTPPTLHLLYNLWYSLALKNDLKHTSKIISKYHNISLVIFKIWW